MNILRSLLALIAAAFLLNLTEAVSAAEKNQYNVLFIAVDDLRPELGCYGVEEAQSPHLDQFSQSATLFERHYVQVPTCGASRYALLTGRSPASSGVTRSNAAAYSGDSAFKTTQTPGAQTMPELFRRSGYQTCCIGKISHTPDGRVFAYNGSGDGREELPFAWDVLATPFGPWKRGWGTFFAYANGRHRESGQGDRDLMEFVVKNDDDLPDGMMADTACEKLRGYSKSDQPFFLGLGFFKPHLPFVATKQDWEAFDGVDLVPSDHSVEKPDAPYWHKSGEFYKYAAPYEKSNPLSNEAQQTARRAYYACVRYVDRQIGKVIDTLKELGLDESTVVVVWGDHGWHLGEQQIWGKHSPFERANRSVLMIRLPGKNPTGRRTLALAETIDLYPTLVDLCEPGFAQTEYQLDGKSLLPVLTGQADSVRETATSYWGKVVSVRSDRYRLITKKSAEETTSTVLYDLQADLDSVDDISADHPEIVRQLLEDIR